MKNLQQAAQIIRYAGFSAKASYINKNIEVKGVSKSDIEQLNKYVSVPVVAA